MSRKEFCRMEYGKDEQGREVLLKDGKFQVMMEWEKPYMQACIDALKPFGDVLEVGFGLGYSADAIQSYHPKSHTIIEYHPEVAKRARAWAKKHPGAIIVEGTWQDALPNLGKFDCIFFDDYPLHTETQVQQMEQDSARSELLLKKGEQLIQEVEKTLPFLSEIKYADADLRALMAQIPKGQIPQFGRFLAELAERGQITEKQLDVLLGELKLSREGVVKKKKELPRERLFSFLMPCLERHMKKGSRFSCFLSSAESKYADDQFVNEIIANPAVDYQEQEIAIEVPANCTYYRGNKALVITITKMI